MKRINFFVLALIFSTLAACGGGDEGYGNGGNGGGTGGGGTGGSGSGGTSLSVSLSLLDEVSGLVTTSITSSGQGTLQATVTDGGTPQSDVLVTFGISDVSFGTLEPSTALTNASGIASVTLNGGTVGAATATANVDIDGETATGSTNFSVTSSLIIITIDMGNGTGAAFEPDVINLSSATLSAGGSLTATVDIVIPSDNNSSYTTESVNVTFESPCTLAGTASIDSPVLTASGTASSTYTAEGCVGLDTITARATINGVIYAAQATVDIQPPVVGSIRFDSASHEVIAIQGTGGTGLSETSTVVFTVLDALDNPVPNQDVNFVLDTNVGGITLTPSSAPTDANGQVQTVVTSGTVNTSVIVTATVAATSISTQSVALAISTGIPDNNSFSIAAQVLNPSVWECNGAVIPITAFVADHFNNPAPNGTAVAFQTEGGIIGGSCITTDGQCSVDWVSNNPRPLDARITILATVIGEEGFDDTNGNGRFDDGEPHANLPEAWRDDNESGSRDADEEFIDFNSNGLYTFADNLYNGVLCTQNAIGLGHCNELIHARSTLTLVMASVDQGITLYETSTGTDVPVSFISLPNDGSVRTFRADVQDPRGQRPPSGTTISVATTNGEIVAGNSTDVLSSSSPGPSSLDFSMKADDTPGQAALTISVNIPASSCQGGVIRTAFVTVDDSLDVTSPNVISSIPTAGQINVAVDIAVFEIKFSEPIDEATLAGNISVTPVASGITPSFVYTYNAATNTVFMFPDVSFSADTLYEVVVGAAVKDTAGNFLNGGSDHSFIFGTAPAP